MTVIQIRGTSGSGKTTAMRRILDYFGDWQAYYVPARRGPIYYQCVSEWAEAIDLFVLGHYESPCGGCDNIGSAKAVHELYRVLEDETRPTHPRVILGEGLLLSEDVIGGGR